MAAWGTSLFDIPLFAHVAFFVFNGPSSSFAPFSWLAIFASAISGVGTIIPFTTLGVAWLDVALGSVSAERAVGVTILPTHSALAEL